jgi:hypothetical protein
MDDLCKIESVEFDDFDKVNFRSIEIHLEELLIYQNSSFSV